MLSNAHLRKLYFAVCAAGVLAASLVAPAGAVVLNAPRTDAGGIQARFLGDVRLYGPALRLALGTASLGAMPAFIEPRNFVPRAAGEPSAPAVARITKAAARIVVPQPVERQKQPASKSDGVFDSVRIKVGNIPAMRRWTRVWSAKACDGTADCARTDAAMRRVTGDTDGMRFLDKLETVNRNVNAKIRYTTDADNYGRRDYWAGPGEIVASGRGDCEDFAILKMAALVKAGVPTESMSIVILYIQSKDVFHAVLSVATSKGSYILDNVRNDVYLDSSNTDYLPLYSLSTDRAWIHGSRVTSLQARNAMANVGDIAPGEGPLTASRIR